MDNSIMYEKDQISTILRLLDNVTVTGLQSMSNLVAVKMILESGKEITMKGASKDSSGKETENGKINYKRNYNYIIDMLGYNFTFENEVIGGDRRGRTIGFPTINQHLPEGLIVPKYGVYESRTFVDGKEYKSFTNIGIRPTWRVDKPLCETHIFDFNGDLYGKTVRVELIDYKREEKIFKNVEELKEQLDYDKSSIV